MLLLDNAVSEIERSERKRKQDTKKEERKREQIERMEEKLQKARASRHSSVLPAVSLMSKVSINCFQQAFGSPARTASFSAGNNNRSHDPIYL